MNNYIWTDILIDRLKTLLDEKKYLELIKDEAKVLMKDKNYFPKLLEKDEGLAKKVLEEYFD
jgi:hypothetical protein